MTHLLIYCFMRMLKITNEIQKRYFKSTILFNRIDLSLILSIVLCPIIIIKKEKQHNALNCNSINNNT